MYLVATLLPSIVRVRNNVVKGKIFNVETLKELFFERFGFLNK